ncbi:MULTISPECIES: hypothetical protein [Bacillus cereus group]|uniref:Uncharacterized protein n=1 Tax=Bacillus cereus VD184 TaxID=1053242 RepID=A0A9W5RA41_BACCE|nr:MULTISPECIES: hypothetical protein [Bacillus cereus group]EOQ17202.1 hypothetical protein IKC_01940 [Bacillus cereus VD184]MCU5203399.1 chromosome segregation protein [Bacillus paranthracis]HDR7764596.1 chromosome segregation protein [Bacillus paranthracis]
MIRQVILSEKEYEEIERELADYSRLKKQLKEFEETKVQLEKVSEEFENFINLVKEMFKDGSGGKFSYRETGKYYNDYLFLKTEIVAELFNMFFEEEFYNETGLKVDRYWNIK